jgi:hypothetical protein
MLGAITAILYGLPLAVTVFDTRESQLLIRTLGPLLRLRRARESLMERNQIVDHVE